MQEQPESIKLKIKRALQLGRALRFVWQSAKGREDGGREDVGELDFCAADDG